VRALKAGLYPDHQQRCRDSENPPESEVMMIIELEQLNPPRHYQIPQNKIDRIERVQSVVERDQLI
jgi:hypothetical protein